MDTAQHIAPGIQGADSAAALRQGSAPHGRSLERSLAFWLGPSAIRFALLVPIVIALAWSGVLFQPGPRHLARTYSCEYNGLSGPKGSAAWRHRIPRRSSQRHGFRLHSAQGVSRSNSQVQRPGRSRQVRRWSSVATGCRLRGCASGFTLRLAACNRSPMRSALVSAYVHREPNRVK
jgi:hypothetical protein